MINRTRLTTIYICKIRPVYKVPSLHLLRGKNYSRKKKQHKSQEFYDRSPRGTKTGKSQAISFGRDIFSVDFTGR